MSGWPDFYFLRHGRTEWNRLGICQGHSDIPLDATGIAQAVAARDALTGLGITHIFASPLSRALRTAEIINEKLAVPITTLDGLKEIRFGGLEGKKKPDPRYRLLLDMAEAVGGESFQALGDRVMAAVGQALACPGPVLIVAHGGVFHALKERLGLPHTEDLANATPLRISPVARASLPA